MRGYTSASPSYFKVELHHADAEHIFQHEIRFLRQGSKVVTPTMEDLSRIITTVEQSTTLKSAHLIHKTAFNIPDACEFLVGNLRREWGLCSVTVYATQLVLIFRNLCESGKYVWTSLGKNFSELQLEIRSEHSDLIWRQEPLELTKNREIYREITQPSTINIYMSRSIATPTWWQKLLQRPDRTDCYAVVARSVCEPECSGLLRAELSGFDPDHLDFFPD